MASTSMSLKRNGRKASASQPATHHRQETGDSSRSTDSVSALPPYRSVNVDTMLATGFVHRPSINISLLPASWGTPPGGHRPSILDLVENVNISKGRLHRSLNTEQFLAVGSTPPPPVVAHTVVVPPMRQPRRSIDVDVLQVSGQTLSASQGQSEEQVERARNEDESNAVNLSETLSVGEHLQEMAPESASGSATLDDEQSNAMASIPEKSRARKRASDCSPARSTRTSAEKSPTALGQENGHQELIASKDYEVESQRPRSPLATINIGNTTVVNVHGKSTASHHRTFESSLNPAMQSRWKAHYDTTFFGCNLHNVSEDVYFIRQAIQNVVCTYLAERRLYEYTTQPDLFWYFHDPQLDNAHVYAPLPEHPYAERFATFMRHVEARLLEKTMANAYVAVPEPTRPASGYDCEVLRVHIAYEHDGAFQLTSSIGSPQSSTESPPSAVALPLRFKSMAESRRSLGATLRQLSSAIHRLPAIDWARLPHGPAIRVDYYAATKSFQRPRNSPQTTSPGIQTATAPVELPPARYGVGYRFKPDAHVQHVHLRDHPGVRSETIGLKATILHTHHQQTDSPLDRNRAQERQTTGVTGGKRPPPPAKSTGGLVDDPDVGFDMGAVRETDGTGVGRRVASRVKVQEQIRPVPLTTTPLTALDTGARRRFRPRALFRDSKDSTSTSSSSEDAVQLARDIPLQMIDQSPPPPSQSVERLRRVAFKDVTVLDAVDSRTSIAGSPGKEKTNGDRKRRIIQVDNEDGDEFGGGENVEEHKGRRKKRRQTAVAKKTAQN